MHQIVAVSDRQEKRKNCIHNFTTFLVDKIIRLGYNMFNLKCGLRFYNFEPTFTFMGFLYCRLDVKPPFAVEGRRLCCGCPPSSS